jgi:hypothetical protein
MAFTQAAIKKFAVDVPAPVPHKGINAISSLAQFDPEEAIYAYNVIADQAGMVVRPGYQEWATGLAGSGGVRTFIPVRANASGGANDKLFATTINGIYDITASVANPGLAVTFGSQVGLAGWGQWEHSTNAGGDLFAVYTDEVNGLFTYDSNTSTWVKATLAFTGVANQTAASSTMTVTSTTSGVLKVGSVISGTGVTPGTTILAFISGTGGNGTYQVSNTVGFASTTISGQALNQTIGVDPANLVGVRLFNNRLWYVEKNTGHAWFTAPGAVTGTLTQFDYGNKFGHGGNLNSLWVFTYGSSLGTYYYLVAIGDAGDVIAFTGNDPTSSTSWSLVGQWYVGDIPPGRRPATNFGGDLTILSSYGAINVSGLFTQENLEDPNAYMSKKIAPAIRTEIANNQTRGWEMVPWAAGNSTLILDPNYINTYQYCYNLATNGWTIFRGVPMQTAVTWQTRLYCGTPDGRVVILQGGQDNVLRDGSGGTAVQWGMLGGFTNLQKPGMDKYVDLIRAYFLGVNPAAYNIFCRFDFNVADLVLGQGVPNVPSGSTTGWDAGLWDSALWGAGGQMSQVGLTGVTGHGRWAAIGILGASNGNTTLIAYEASVRVAASFL